VCLTKFTFLDKLTPLWAIWPLKTVLSFVKTTELGTDFQKNSIFTAACRYGLVRQIIQTALSVECHPKHTNKTDDTLTLTKTDLNSSKVKTCPYRLNYKMLSSRVEARRECQLKPSVRKTGLSTRLAVLVPSSTSVSTLYAFPSWFGLIQHKLSLLLGSSK
jgi:hypothetical protein